MLNLNEGITEQYHNLLKEATDTSHENISEIEIMTSLDLIDDNFI